MAIAKRGMHGFEIDAPEEEVVLQTLALAVGQCSEADYTSWLDAACRPQEDAS